MNVGKKTAALFGLLAAGSGLAACGIDKTATCKVSNGDGIAQIQNVKTGELSAVYVNNSDNPNLFINHDGTQLVIDNPKGICTQYAGNGEPLRDMKLTPGGL